ncbi:hypothetical protein DPMN_030848 [Dreissena polymorpha]|uniref:Uncharacterized protein n=1 Tax=Dreissena polymorpha TaxID=45954 RepID=A0A9D4M0R1_DREPO|nr:hypothetical protein DPMN_030848 [Dreissena polymorpha]
MHSHLSGLVNAWVRQYTRSHEVGVLTIPIAVASGSGGRRFEPHGERLSKDGCLSWDLFRYGRLVSRER